MYGLASGSLRIEFPLIAEEPVAVHRAEVGFWIGDAAVLADLPRMVSLIAASETRMLHLPSGAIHKLLLARPEHWRDFYRLSAENVATAIRLLSEALALTVRARVCRRLLALSEGSSEARITQDELAAIVGVARPTLRRCLTDLADRGAIEMQYRRLRILKRAVLQGYQDEQ